MLKVNFENSTINEEERRVFADQLKSAHEQLHNGTGEGADFLGWLNLRIQDDELNQIKAALRKCEKSH